MEQNKKKKPFILAIVGPSGAGKTYIANWLNKEGYCKTIVSATTREMRPGETDGVDHWFKKVEDMPDKDQMLAYTFFGGNHYWTSFDQLDINNYNTYVIDEQGICDLYDLEEADKITLLWCQIERPNNPTEQTRLDRDNDRAPALAELERRGKKPDVTIINDGTLEDLHKKLINRLFPQLLLKDLKSASKGSIIQII